MKSMLTKKQRSWWKNQVNIINGNIKGEVTEDVEDCYNLYLQYNELKKKLCDLYVEED